MQIKEHRDCRPGYEDGEDLVPIPVSTNPEVECWYHNLNLPRRVTIRGATNRIHPVIGCVVNERLREPRSATDAVAPNQRESARLSRRDKRKASAMVNNAPYDILVNPFTPG